MNLPEPLGSSPWAEGTWQAQVHAPAQGRAPWLKTMLAQCAWTAKRKKDSCYGAQFHRLSGRRGPQKAICAVAAALLTAIYHMLKDGTVHHGLGANHFDRRPTQVRIKHLVAPLAKLGYQVQLQPLPEAA